MVVERGRAGAFSRGARGVTPRKKEAEAEGAGCGVLLFQPSDLVGLARGAFCDAGDPGLLA